MRACDCARSTRTALSTVASTGRPAARCQGLGLFGDQRIASRIECFQCALGDALGRAQLTNSAASPLAHETLLFKIASPSFLHSVAPRLALAEGLVELPANRAGKAVVRRIDEAERQLFDAGAYRPVPRGG